MIASSIKVGFQMKDYFVSDKSSSNLILCPMSVIRLPMSEVGKHCGSLVSAFAGLGLPNI